MTSQSPFPESVDENARRRFERAWGAGEPEPIEACLPPEGHPSYAGTLEELVSIELELAWRQGAGSAGGARAGPPSPALVEGYLARFPALDDLDTKRRLVGEEYRVRHLHGDRPPLGEYRERFPDLALQDLERELPDVAAQAESTRLPQVPGYEILDVLGRGGMGVVYRARHVGLDRQVALKMLLAGGHASSEELARFRAEAGAVARLQHPNIVQIHEVGEHEGRPYISLEYVGGGSLAQQLAQAPLGGGPAAAMVQVLARAVQYAHEHGIIHRDLKPSNVLLTREGTPKISDFGLAKTLEVGHSQDLRTRTGDLVGTPSFMAPEQAAGRRAQIGPGVDVYALGAILYEMLSGRPPFRAETPWDTVAQVIAQEPVSPARLNPRTSRDLETICLKCLQKDPGKRYASCQDLADDLARHLAGEPILARRISAWTRLGKWVRRRPMTAALVLVSSLAVASLLLGSLWYGHKLEEALARERQQHKQVEEQRSIAQANLPEARDAVDQMLTRVAQGPLSRLPHMEPVVELMLEDALRYYRGFLERGRADPGVRHETARAYRRVGDIRAKLGSAPEAEEFYRLSLSMLEQLTSDDPANVDAWIDLAQSLCSHGHLLHSLDRNLESQTAFERAIRIGDALVRDSPGDARGLFVLGRSRQDLASLHSSLFQTAESERLFLEAQEVLERLVTDHPESAAYRSQLAQAYHNHGLLLRNVDRLEEASEPLREAIRLKQALLASAPDDPQARADLAVAHGTLGILLWDLERDAEAQVALREALLLQRALAQDHPSVPAHQSALAGTLHNLGELLLRGDDDEGACELFSEAIRHHLAAYRTNPDDPGYREQLFYHHWASSETLAELGRHRQAVDVARQMPTFGSREPQTYLTAASVLSRCIPLAEADQGLDPDERTALAASYGQQAMQMLREAVGLGFDDAQHLTGTAEFQPLITRADFVALLAEMRAAQRAGHR